MKVTNLALQGGGAHGAFTWGVLDRLLEETNLNIEGISGSSAGAMNAVMLANGMMTGGHEGARECLTRFWSGVSAKSMSDSPVKLMTTNDWSPAYTIAKSLGWFMSPYQFNPLAIDPLSDLVNDMVDFDKLRHDCPINLYVAATRVRTGKIRIFENHELSTDALMASACLPSLHRAVEIDGEPYWDGAFAGNPAIYPLLHGTKSRDIIAVLLAPLERKEVPTSAEEIRNRVADLSFNAAFLREMRAIADVQNRFDRGIFTLGRLERLICQTRFHIIEAEDLMNKLSHKSKLNTSASFLNMLFLEGRQHAENWFAKDYSALGARSSVNLSQMFE